VVEFKEIHNIPLEIIMTSATIKKADCNFLGEVRDKFSDLTCKNLKLERR
jgi:hypothetical protein